MKIKKGDNVIVIAGKHKGQTGTVAKVIKETGRVIVGGVNKATVRVKAKRKTEKGSTVEREAPLHASNVMLVEGGKRTRVGYKADGEKKVRIAKKTKKELK